MWRAAQFAGTTDDGIECRLCPHACRLAPGERGRCRARRHLHGRLETATWSVTVRHRHPIERKPLYHVLPGAQTLSLAAPGCTFECRFCINHRLSQSSGVGKPADPSEILERARQMGVAVIAFSFSEPTLAAELTLALAPGARALGLGMVWNTNGFITSHALEQIAPVLLAVNVDLKVGNEATHQALTGAPLRPVLDAMAAFHRAGTWVEVSTPLIPRVNTSRRALIRLAELIARVDVNVPWHLVRFYPSYRLIDRPPTPPQGLELARSIAREVGLRHVYVARGLGAAGRHTHCPGCGALSIERGLNDRVEVCLHDGCCSQCGQSIPGRWEAPCPA